LIVLAGRFLPVRSRKGIVSAGIIALAVLALCVGLGVEVLAHWRAGIRPDTDAHGALAYMASFLQLQLVLALVVMAGFAMARSLAGVLGRRHRVVFDNLALLWHFTVMQGLFGLLLVHGFPRIA
jgi:cytochrome c oxidase subunit I+III